MILGTIGILCGIYFLVRNVLWISMSEDIQKFAKAEGLTAHANSIKVRFED